MTRFSTKGHKHYCGIAPHARTMYDCFVNREGVVLLHQNLACDRGWSLAVIRPYREDLAAHGAYR